MKWKIIRRILELQTTERANFSLVLGPMAWKDAVYVTQPPVKSEVYGWTKKRRNSTETRKLRAFATLLAEIRVKVLSEEIEVEVEDEEESEEERVFTTLFYDYSSCLCPDLTTLRQELQPAGF